MRKGADNIVLADWTSATASSEPRGSGKVELAFGLALLRGVIGT